MGADQPLVRWDWIAAHLGSIGQRTLEHVWLTCIAVGVGFAISFVLALLVWRYRKAYGPVTGVAGILYTIPSLALFAALVPFTGITVLTAEIPLVSYTILILVRNTVAGLAAVPEEMREAATGMGYTGWQRMWRVELPLALPVIVTGLRVATVSTIGLVTVAGLVGQGGLGALIYEGLEAFFATKVYVGAVVSVALAIAADLGFLGLQALATPWARAQRAS
jgi:osmoprotectant transport system permease protein